MTEADVARQCDALMTAGGWAVQRLEQRRASRIAPGLPDRRYVHSARQLRLWVELKTPGGKLTTEQAQFVTDELNAGGLAAPIDDPDQLAKLCAILAGPRVGRMTDAAIYCRQLLALTVQRGYRRVAA